jgi:tetratricopeptide (TPR) repeat protein
VRARRDDCLTTVKDVFELAMKKLRSRDIDDASFMYIANQHFADFELCGMDESGVLMPPVAIRDRVMNARERLLEAGMEIIHGRAAKANTILREVEALEIDWVPFRAELALLQGDAAYAVGDNEGALALYRKGLAHAEASAHDRSKPQAAVNIAIVLVKVGRLDEASTQLDLAEAMTVRASDRKLQPSIMNLRARIADLRGNTDEAVRIYLDAITKYKALGAVTEAAQSQIFLYGIYLRLGKVAEAKALREEFARVLKEQLPTVADTAFHDRCLEAMTSGELAHAIQLCRQAVTDLEGGGDSYELANALQALGIAFDLGEHWADAREQHVRAAEMFERVNRPIDAAFTFEIAGRDSIDLEEYPRAIQFFERSLALAKGNPDQLMFSRSGLGRAFAESGKHLEAITLLEAVIPELEGKKTQNVLATSRFALAQALWKRAAPGDRDRAREQANLAKGDAAKFRATFADDVGAKAIFRQRMNALIDRIDAWLASK